MKTFIFKVVQSSNIRGYNRTVEVYQVKNNEPIYVGYNDQINTASYRGDKAVASKIISDKLGYKMKNSYDLLRKDIRLLEI